LVLGTVPFRVGFSLFLNALSHKHSVKIVLISIKQNIFHKKDKIN